MPPIKTPENMEIAALRKKAQTVFDPMVPGSGTPWEDRGSHGTVGAFFKSSFASLFSAGQLLNSIRRPETTNDARGYLYGICACWGLSGLIHAGIAIHRDTKIPDSTLDPVNTAVICGLASIGVGVGVFFLFKIFTAIYGRLVAQEKDAPLMPEVLLFNVNAYAMGPSILAIIPFAGPVLALLWILVAQIIAGSSRLRLRLPAAVIDAVISLFAVVAITVVGYVLIEMVLLNRVMDFHAVIPPAPKPHTPGFRP